MTHRPGRFTFAGAGRLALWGLLLISWAPSGCDRGEPAPPEPPPAETETPAAAPEHYLVPTSHAPAPPVAIVPLPPAPKPTGPLPRGASCVTAECHTMYANARHIHGPVSKGACSACHQDDVGGHSYPVLRDKTALCTFCHVVSGTAAHQHKALEQGCTVCHRPHVSKTKFLLKGDSVEQLCISCHKMPWKRHTHSILLTGNCMLCHQAHQSDNRHLLFGGDGPKHCYLCHEGIHEAMDTALYRHKPAEKECTGCHDPHTSDSEYQLKEPMARTCLEKCHQKVNTQVAQASVPHGAVLTVDRCANCHDAHSSDYPDLLRHRMDHVCLGCHDRPIAKKNGETVPDMRPVLVDAAFLHGPVRSGDCSACHEAHGGQRAMLLTRPFVEKPYADFDVNNFALCFGCHTSQLVLTEKTHNLTGFRNGEDNLHYVHVNRDRRGRTCRTCHKVHGSNLPKHMASETTLGGSRWPVPIGFRKTPTGGGCTPGCHAPASYDRRHPVRPPIARPESRPASQPARGPTTQPTTQPTTHPTTRGAQ